MFKVEGDPELVTTLMKEGLKSCDTYGLSRIVGVRETSKGGHVITVKNDYGWGTMVDVVVNPSLRGGSVVEAHPTHGDYREYEQKIKEVEESLEHYYHNRYPGERKRY